MMRIVAITLLAGLVTLASLPSAALELDRRRMLNAAEHVPWRAVGRVNIATTIGTSMCTGTLIAEDLVLTAAHCVIERFSRRPYKPGLVHFVAGWRLGQKVAASTAKAIVVHPAYNTAPKLPGSHEIEEIAADLALIRLETPIPAAKAPFFRIAPAPEEGAPLTLISYRQDRPHALTRQEGCNIVERQNAVVTLGCDVTFGASGSSLFTERDGAMQVVAVLSAMGHENGRTIAFAVLVDAVIGEVLAALE